MAARVFELIFIDVKVTEITLLSIEEAKNVPIHIREIGNWWWLRSPGRYGNCAAIVNYNGYFYDIGYFVNSPSGAVRPALRISNLESSNLKVGDIIKAIGYCWTIITEDLALCNVAVGETCFREKWRHGSDANDYEASDIKKWLENWARENKLDIEETGGEE